MQDEAMYSVTRRALLLCAAAAGAAWAAPAAAQKRYDPGASDTEIRIGQTMPYSGPVSMLGTIGKATAAYFDKLNAEAGINGRKLKLISLDDAYSPSKTVEGTRRLVEEDEVLLVFGTVGTATNLAVHRYLNTRKVPQLLILSGANRWNDPRNFPYTLSGMLSYQAEARMYARHMLATVKEPKIAVLSQNDDFGRDFVAGLKVQLGERAKTLIVAEATYEVTDPTVDSQMVMLKSSGANAQGRAEECRGNPADRIAADDGREPSGEPAAAGRRSDAAVRALLPLGAICLVLPAAAGRAARRDVPALRRRAHAAPDRPAPGHQRASGADAVHPPAAAG